MVEEYDVDDKGGKPNRSGIILFLVLILITLGSAFIAYAKSVNTDLDTLNIREAVSTLFGRGNKKEIKENVKKITYDPREYSAFAVSRDSLIQCTTRSVTWFDRSGKEKKTAAISANRPVVKSTGSFTLIADLNGKDLYLFKGYNLLWSKRTSNRLINADVSEDGFVTAVEEGSGYKAKVDVFDPQLKESLLLTRTIAECFVLGARVLPSGRQLMINKVDASGITANTRFEFSEMFAEKPFADVKRENVIFPAIYYISDDSVLAVGDSAVIYLDRNKKVKWHKEYDSRKVYGAAVSQEKYGIIAVDGSKASITGMGVVIDVVKLKDGQQAASFNVQGSIHNLSASGNVIGINNGREVRFYDLKGRELGFYKAGADITDLELFNDKAAVVITKNDIVILSIK